MYETSMIRLTQTKMKMYHASSIQPIKNKLFTDEKILHFLDIDIVLYAICYAAF
jgi:hypothetical protein